MTAYLVHQLEWLRTPPGQRRRFRGLPQQRAMTAGRALSDFYAAQQHAECMRLCGIDRFDLAGVLLRRAVESLFAADPYLLAAEFGARDELGYFAADAQKAVEA